MQLLLWLKAPCLFTSNLPGAANHRLKSVVREIRTLRSVGAGGRWLPSATRSGREQSRPATRYWGDVP